MVGAQALVDNPVSPRIQEIILTIDPVVDALVVERIPKISGGCHGRDRAERIAVVTAGICCVAEPFQEWACVSAGRKAVPEHADFAIGIVIVERYELFSQVMDIWRDFPAKQSERRIIVTPSQVAQNLVVRSVFLDYVEYVLDGQLEPLIWTVNRRPFVDLASPGSKICFDVGHWDDAERPLKQGQDIVRAAFPSYRLRTVLVRAAPANTLRAQHQKPIILGNDPGRIPSCWY